ncbi:MAG TPA: universal stress protein [Kofleriaceae bacterium]
MRFHKILCPIDFSAGSQYALRTAARIAAASEAELVVANVWYMPPMAYAGDAPVPADAVQFLVDDSKRGLAQAERDASSLGARRVTTALLSGVPWEQLVALLGRDETFDLVVMGTHGRTGLSRILLGSVAEQVVRHAPCPVLTVRDRGEAGTFQHVLCPVDFSDSSRRAVELAGSIAAPGGAGIALLHVLELPVAYSGELKIPGLVEDLDRRAAGMLERWAAELRAKVSVPVVARSRIGRPGAQILAAQDGDPSFDLVVMGGHGRTGLPRLLLGSVAEQVIRHASCPVLVARSRMG